jgi:pyruvate formate lyase activating enzyme
MQAGFLREALVACKSSGFHTTVDTSGYGPWEPIASIIQYTDLFLFDIKHLDDTRHTDYTGVSNSTIIANFKNLLYSGKEIILRIPVIPGINDSEFNLTKTRDLIFDSLGYNLTGINLLPFHRIGISKYRNLGLSYRMNETEPPGRERMKDLIKFFSVTGLKVKTGG